MHSEHLSRVPLTGFFPALECVTTEFEDEPERGKTLAHKFQPGSSNYLVTFGKPINPIPLSSSFSKT